jgi:hypothetical protein
MYNSAAQVSGIKNGQRLIVLQIDNYMRLGLNNWLLKPGDSISHEFVHSSSRVIYVVCDNRLPEHYCSGLLLLTGHLMYVPPRVRN